MIWLPASIGREGRRGTGRLDLDLAAIDTLAAQTFLIIRTANCLFVEGFGWVDGTFEIVFACKKDTAIAWNLMQSLEMEQVLFERLPDRAGEINEN
jgi:hypothetical protein